MERSVQVVQSPREVLFLDLLEVEVKQVDCPPIELVHVGRVTAWVCRHDAADNCELVLFWLEDEGKTDHRKGTALLLLAVRSTAL